MTTIKSTFDKSSEGWIVSGNTNQGWQSSGGNPGGFFGWTDDTSGSTALYVAPTNFLGDKSDFFGGKISYDIFDSSGDSQPSAPDLFLTGSDGHSLYVNLTTVGTGWTHESVKLSTNAGWIDVSTGAAPTKAAFKDVLDHLAQVTVRAEYFSGAESGGLDNFKLTSKGGDANVAPAFGHHADAAHLPIQHDPSASLAHLHLAIA